MIGRLVIVHSHTRPPTIWNQRPLAMSLSPGLRKKGSGDVSPYAVTGTGRHVHRLAPSRPLCGWEQLYVRIFLFRIALPSTAFPLWAFPCSQSPPPGDTTPNFISHWVESDVRLAQSRSKTQARHVSTPWEPWPVAGDICHPPSPSPSLSLSLPLFHAHAQA